MVQFFLAMLFSSPTDLGWDSTVQISRIPSDTVQYEYTVSDADGTQTVYRTLDLIAESGKSNPKGLRVWRAVEVRDGIPHGEVVVLKDVWRLLDIPQEGSNMRAIAEPQPDSDMSDAEKEALRRGVLTVLHHGDVMIRSPSRGCSTTLTECRPDPLVLHLETYSHSLSEQLGDFGSSEDLSRSGERSGRRVHYRAVVKELCTSLYDVRRDHEKVYRALAEVCEGES